MGLIAKDTGGNFEPVPAGTHVARCYLLADIGEQEMTFKGETKVMHKIIVGWELPHERIEFEKDGEKLNRPMAISKTYTLSLNEKANLRHDLAGWRGRDFTKEELEGFDLHDIVGKPCQVSVVHRESNGKTYANVSGVVAVTKGMTVPEAELPEIVYDLDDPKDEVFAKLPEWIRRKIAGDEDEDVTFP